MILLVALIGFFIVLPLALVLGTTWMVARLDPWISGGAICLLVLSGWGWFFGGLPLLLGIVFGLIARPRRGYAR